MNYLSVFCLLIGISVVYCAPYVDVHNDNRPILDVIAPEDVLVNKKKNLYFVLINPLHSIIQPIVEKERATNIEVEGIPSKGLSLYDQSQKKVSEVLLSNVC